MCKGALCSPSLRAPLASITTGSPFVRASVQRPSFSQSSFSFFNAGKSFFPRFITATAVQMQCVLYAQAKQPFVVFVYGLGITRPQAESNSSRRRRDRMVGVPNGLRRTHVREIMLQCGALQHLRDRPEDPNSSKGRI